MEKRQSWYVNVRPRLSNVERQTSQTRHGIHFSSFQCSALERIRDRLRLSRGRRRQNLREGRSRAAPGNGKKRCSTMAVLLRTYLAGAFEDGLRFGRTTGLFEEPSIVRQCLSHVPVFGPECFLEDPESFSVE